MSCDHLICAACAGPVIEGRCTVCRTARAHVHGSTPFTLTPQLAVLLAAALALLVVLAMHLR